MTLNSTESHQGLLEFLTVTLIHPGPRLCRLSAAVIGIACNRQMLRSLVGQPDVFLIDIISGKLDHSVARKEGRTKSKPIHKSGEFHRIENGVNAFCVNQRMVAVVHTSSALYIFVEI